MKYLFPFLILFNFTSIKAQQSWEQIIRTKVSTPMESHLWKIGMLNDISSNEAEKKAKEYGLRIRTDQKIRVEIINGSDFNQGIDASVITTLGAEVMRVRPKSATLWLAPSQLIPVAQQLPDPLIMITHHIASEIQGPGLINSQSFIDAGHDGSGIRIAIIDSGFQNLATAVAAGDAPSIPLSNRYDWVGDGLGIAGNTRHGTGCLEAAFDHAPGATYFIHRIGDVQDAVDQAIIDNVDIISFSVSAFNTGWEDDSGYACAAVSDATMAGILYFTAAGNRNGEHWQGDWHDPDSDNLLNWSGTDSCNNITIQDSMSVHIFMQWDPGANPFVDDYDMDLYNATSGVLLESSNSIFSYESITWTNTSGAPVQVCLQVRNSGLNNNEIEVMFHTSWICSVGCTGNNSNFTYPSITGSSTSPSNSLMPNCISVGAVDTLDYPSAEGTSGIVMSYSGRGPTNSGNQAPDIVAPTNTLSTAYSGIFTGTSCATPNAAGAAAAFWSAHSYLSSSGMRMLLFRQAELHNDWGPGGADHWYGRGGLELLDYISNSRFIYHDGNNVLGVSTLPYFNIEQVDDIGTPNRTMIFLGETFPAPTSVDNLINTPMLYVNPKKETTIK